MFSPNKIIFKELIYDALIKLILKELTLSLEIRKKVHTENANHILIENLSGEKNPSSIHNRCSDEMVRNYFGDG